MLPPQRVVVDVLALYLCTMSTQLLEMHVEQSTGAMRESEEMLRARELLGLSLCNRSIIKLYLGDTYSGKVTNSRTSLCLCLMLLVGCWGGVIPLSPFYSMEGVFLVFVLWLMYLMTNEYFGSFSPYIYDILVYIDGACGTTVSEHFLTQTEPKRAILGYRLFGGGYFYGNTLLPPSPKINISVVEN